MVYAAGRSYVSAPLKPQPSRIPLQGRNQHNDTAEIMQFAVAALTIFTTVKETLLVVRLLDSRETSKVPEFKKNLGSLYYITSSNHSLAVITRSA
jgi:hypothetical protein